MKFSFLAAAVLMLPGFALAAAKPKPVPTPVTAPAPAPIPPPPLVVPAAIDSALKSLVDSKQIIGASALISIPSGSFKETCSTIAFLAAATVVSFSFS